jgi:hypothetical protein
MSQYTTTRARLAVRGLVASADAMVGSVQRLAEHCDAVQASLQGDLLPSAGHIAELVSTLPDAQLEVASLPDELRLLHEACAESPTVTTTLPELRALSATFAADEVAATRQALALALGEMGFHAETRTEGNRSMIWATRDDQVVASEITVSGIEIDTAGCADDVCVPIIQELARRSAARGLVLDLDRADTLRHGDTEGGTLLQRWAEFEPESPTRREARAQRRRMLGGRS